MFYRLHQFWQALFPQILPTETAWLEKNLDLAALSLFKAQSLADQRHALDVARSVAIYQAALPKEEYNSLLLAALFHDCGKSLTTVRLWHRVFIVLAHKLPVKVRSFLENGSTPLAEPLNMAAHHAILGAELAAKVGFDQQTCSLILQHHNPKSKLGTMLAEADNAN